MLRNCNSSNCYSSNCKFEQLYFNFFFRANVRSNNRFLSNCYSSNCFRDIYRLSQKLYPTFMLHFIYVLLKYNYLHKKLFLLFGCLVQECIIKVIDKAYIIQMGNSVNKLVMVIAYKCKI